MLTNKHIYGLVLIKTLFFCIQTYKLLLKMNRFFKGSDRFIFYFYRENY